MTMLEQAAGRLEGMEKGPLVEAEGRYRRREQVVARFVAAYRHYRWSVEALADPKLAPFPLFAAEGHLQTDKDHIWHRETLVGVCRVDPELLLAYRYKVVDVTEPASQHPGVEWSGGVDRASRRGIVVKPLSFFHRGNRGIPQPLVECRGGEYPRVNYSPEHTTRENPARLRSRGLGRERPPALGEFVLAVEGPERFVRGEPLRRVHECFSGVMAMVSEPVDPRF